MLRTFLTLFGSVVAVTGLYLGVVATPASAQVVDKSLPADSGIINVKTGYGAKGDGKTDDTQAIQKAIKAGIDKMQIVYFPKGTYLVSGRLEGKDSSGKWKWHMKLRGQNREQTVIKLKDNAPGYTDPSNPKAVVYTASACLTNCPSGGGKDYNGKGEGNEAIGNYVENLTVDTGKGNKGAVGIDYLANNYGAVRDVTIRGEGTVGLSMQRKWPGPCLIKDVTVEGFDYGVYTKNREYGITFENISLSGQQVAGIRNEENVLSVRKLTSTNTVPAVQNAHANGMVTLLDSNLGGGSSSASAIDNSGELFARNVNTTGYRSAIKNKGTVVQGTTVPEYASRATHKLFSWAPQKSLNLPVKETPTFHDNNLANWANVESYGADGDDWDDDTEAIQAALDSGKQTVYFPKGRYFAKDTLRVRGSVRKIAGMDSMIGPAYGTFNDANNPKPLFKFETGNYDVMVERLNVRKLHSSSSVAGLVAFEQASSKALVLRDNVTNKDERKHSYRSTSGAGPLFLENVVGPKWQFGNSQSVFARQFNPEYNGTKITNAGASLWVLGLKTEGNGTVISTSGGGRTELLGGLVYPATTVSSGDIAFPNNGSNVSLTYATSGYTSGQLYQIHVKETQGGVSKTLTRSQVTTRHASGTFVPLYRGAPS